jgi:hypothetical protein
MSVPALRPSQSPSQAVIEAVADREGVDPVNLSIPLYDTIDPDALDTIVQGREDGTESSIRVEFTYYGYSIAVSAGDSVQVLDAP